MIVHKVKLDIPISEEGLLNMGFRWDKTGYYNKIICDLNFTVYSCDSNEWLMSCGTESVDVETLNDIDSFIRYSFKSMQDYIRFNINRGLIIINWDNLIMYIIYRILNVSTYRSTECEAFIYKNKYYNIKMHYMNIRKFIQALYEIKYKSTCNTLTEMILES